MTPAQRRQIDARALEQARDVGYAARRRGESVGPLVLFPMHYASYVVPVGTVYNTLGLAYDEKKSHRRYHLAGNHVGTAG